MRNVSDKNCRGNQNTHFVLNIFSCENGAVNVEQFCTAGQPQMTIRRMRIACWILKATNTLTICNTHCFSTATMVARTRLNVTLYVHCLSGYYYRYIRIANQHLNYMFRHIKSIIVFTPNTVHIIILAVSICLSI